MPSILHALGVDTNDRADLLLFLLDLGVCELARPPADANPGLGAARLAVGRGHEDVATKRIT